MDNAPSWCNFITNSQGVNLHTINLHVGVAASETGMEIFTFLNGLKTIGANFANESESFQFKFCTETERN